MPPHRLFVFGLGYAALALARRLMAAGWRVAGTTRSEAKRLDLARLGIDAVLFARDLPLADLAGRLQGTTHLLSSVPPDAEGDPVLDRHAGDLAALAGLAWAGYLSTTGVYGDRGGEWVDEGSALLPTGPRGAARAAAEARWLGLAGLGVHVFRVAAIYGPGRSAFDTLRAGRARRIVKPGQVFGRIHVEDLAGVLAASMARPDPGSIYNVCDDDPAPPQDVIAFAAVLLGLEAPPEIPFAEAVAALSEMARGFYADNKRVSNRKIKERLGVRLAYPDYRAGLMAILKAEPGTAPPRSP
ncbi:MAG: SDR family oxidoreductase [Pseudomonadota bacterium]